MDAERPGRDEVAGVGGDPGTSPITVPPAPLSAGLDDAEMPAWVSQATLGFVALGVVLRLARYLLNFPLWCDESMIAANFLDRGYAGLLEPLDYRQVAPLGFLAIELTATRLLGFSEMSLRLFPMLCAVASVPLLRHVAGRFLRGVPLLLAVAIFAVSGWPLRYAAEVKPYASDLFVALGLLALAVEWWRSPGRVGWLWGLAAAAPMAVATSFPSLFVLGGIGIALLVPVWRRGTWRARLPFVLMGVGTLATFLALSGFYRTAPQDHAYFHRDWATAFPPLDGVGRFAAWFLSTNTGFMFAYPTGGERGASAATFLAFLIAAAVLWRTGRHTILGLGLAPFGLALVAAAMHRYPYGMSARTMQYAAPAICLLAGLGTATALGWLRPRRRRRVLTFLVVALAALGAGRMTRDLVHPYKTPTDAQQRAFSKWFWTEQSRGAIVACVGTELGGVFDDRHWNNDATDTYLCYRRIYSPRHRRGEPLRLEAVSAERPLRCVLFNEYPQDTPAFRDWMDGMLERYDLRRFQVYPVGTLERQRGQTWDWVYQVYEFVPRNAPPGGPPPGRIARAERP